MEPARIWSSIGEDGQAKGRGSEGDYLIERLQGRTLDVLSLQLLKQSPGPIVVRLCCSFPNHYASCWRRNFVKTCTARAQGPRDFGSLGVREAREETTARIPSRMEFSQSRWSSRPDCCQERSGRNGMAYKYKGLGKENVCPERYACHWHAVRHAHGALGPDGGTADLDNLISPHFPRS